MRTLKHYLLAALLASGAYGAKAQGTKVYNDPDAGFKTAKDYYQQSYYSLAYPLFKTLQQPTTENSQLADVIRSEVNYYVLVCGLKLDDATAVDPAVRYIASQDNAARKQMASYHLAEYYFRHQQYDLAMQYYTQAGLGNLTNREIADMKFHQAYAYFTQSKFDEALPLFDAIRQIPEDPNFMEANYYYGFIAFYKKNYTQALKSFLMVENHPDYTNVVPYYITEIYYFQGNKDKALSYGEAALKRGGQYYDIQLKQLVGHLYFEKKQFSNALPYLEEYVAHSDKVRREDLYELSYCYYETGQLDKAITGFKELGGKEDSLAQNSMYLLGDAYLKTGNKVNARNAFLFCATNSSNAAQAEVSRFNYAKLSFELGYLDIALNELQQFIANYPKSSLQPEAKELLVDILSRTNHYRDALELYKQLNPGNENVKRIYPRILYGRVTELVNDQQIVQADALLNTLLRQPYNQQQLPFAWFWKGEIAYRQHHEDSAIYYMQQYMKSPAENGEVNGANARYVLGYAYFRQKNYKEALRYFEQIATSINASSNNVQQDAYLRSADCYFMQKNLKKALPMYETILSNGLQSADYATYQKAVILGASNNTSEKINLLRSIPATYPRSPLVNDALMEIADTYLSIQDDRNAIAPLAQIMGNRNATAYHPGAYLKSGIAYFNLKDNDKALEYLKKLVSTYPNAPESEEAVDYVKNIYIGNQQASEYVAFMKQNGRNISYGEEDSLTYVASALQYDEGQLERATSGFENYATKFPDGKYALEAHYRLATIYDDKKDYTNAIRHYSDVAAKAPNRFAEQSVLQAARIYYFELKDYANAEKYFNQLKSIATNNDNKLESMRGLLRCQFKLNEFAEAAPNAQDLLQQKGLATDDRMMANMVIAKNAQTNNQLPEALASYRAVVALGKSEISAEARYHIAEILFAQKKMSEAEKAAFDVINKAGSYNYWITKAYILLGDVYFAQKDYFNAEATLKSVVENATITELQQEAQQKLDAVVAEKNNNSKVLAPTKN